VACERELDGKLFMQPTRQLSTELHHLGIDS
jgi:hypothetical protein